MIMAAASDIDIGAYATNPTVVYVTIAIAVLTVVSQAFPRILGPISQAIYDFLERRRTSRVAAADQEGRDLLDALNNLRAELGRMRRQEEVNRAALQHHDQWDWEMLHLARAAGVIITSPPPLYGSLIE